MKLGSLSLDSLATAAPRERRMLAVGAVAAALLFVFAVLVPLDRSVSRAQQRIAQKKVDLAWMQAAAPEIATPARSPRRQRRVAAGHHRPLGARVGARQVLQQRAGRGRQHRGAHGEGPLRHPDRLARAILAQQNGVVVDSATIEKSGAPGLVNAAIVLHAG